MADEKKVAKKDRTKWLREMRSELKKIVWPNAKTTAKNTGTVEEIEPAKNKVRVVVSMFGRETPVELELDQVEVLK